MCANANLQRLPTQQKKVDKDGTTRNRGMISLDFFVGEASKGAEADNGGISQRFWALLSG
jgi:hypothetical protein